MANDVVVKLRSDPEFGRTTAGLADQHATSPTGESTKRSTQEQPAGQVDKMAPSADTATVFGAQPLYMDCGPESMRGNLADPSGGQGRRALGSAQPQPSEYREPQRIRACTWFILATIATATVFLTVLYWFLTGARSQPPSPNACTTFACRQYVKRLHATVNRSANPCQSFTRFVCDGWRQNNMMSVWEDYFRQVLGRLNRTLRKVQWPPHGQNEEQRVAAVYQSCDDVLQGRSDQLPAVKTALAEAGIVWPHRSRSADVLYALMYCSLRLGWDVLLRFRVERSAGGKPELFVHPGKSLYTLLALHTSQRTNTRKQAYFEFLRVTFQDGGNSPYAGSVTYQDTSQLDDHAIITLRKVFYEVPTVRSIAGIVNTLPHINLTETRWLETLGKLNVSAPAYNPYPHTTSIGYVHEVFRLWDTFGEDSFHLFLSWCTVQIAALYANRDLIWNFYYQYRHAVDLYHAAFCVTRAAYFSSHAVFARYNREVLQGDAEHVARKLVLSVRRAFFRRLYSWEYLDEDITVIANWSSLSTVFRNFDQEKSTESVVHDSIPDMTRSLVENWKHSALVQHTQDSDHLLHAVDDLHTQVFVASEQDVQLMPYALSYPLFDVDLPAAVNYGGLGADVGTVIAYLIFYTYAAVKEELMAPFFKCMRRSPFSNVTNVAAYAHGAVMLGALIEAYNATSSGLDMPVPGFEGYSGLQTLFISQCYTQCKGSRQKDGEFACDVYLQHVPEFAEAFSCSQGDPMYPAHQCRLF